MMCWQQEVKATNPSSESIGPSANEKGIDECYLKNRLEACRIFILNELVFQPQMSSTEMSLNAGNFHEEKNNLSAIIILEFYCPRLSIIIGQMIKYTLLCRNAL